MNRPLAAAIAFAAAAVVTRAAEGAIVYHDPADVTAAVTQHGVADFINGVFNNAGGAGVDINNIEQTFLPLTPFGAGTLVAVAADTGSVDRFLDGSTIGASGGTGGWGSGMKMIDNANGSRPWETNTDGTEGFIGVQLAGPLYGWLRVTYNPIANTIVLRDMAYDDSGAAILAGATAVPEPASAALLAFSAGVLLRRRTN